MRPLGRIDYSSALFLLFELIAEIIRAPHRRRNRKEWRSGELAETRLDSGEIITSVVGFIGLQVLPTYYALAPSDSAVRKHLAFADLSLGRGARGILSIFGAVSFASSLALLYFAHRDLGQNWSPTLQLQKEHKLITTGVYGYLRHPIYSALGLWSLAQTLLLPNMAVGLSGLIGFLSVVILRVPREERMMRDSFGQEYRDYERRVGGIFPRIARLF